jgi:hypothetical protein
VWDTPDIWLRREFKTETEVKGQFQLDVNHDEDAEIYLDGQKIASLKGHNGEYAAAPLPELKSLPAGVHTLAIHCRQTEGGQYIDAGLSTEEPFTLPRQ